VNRGAGVAGKSFVLATWENVFKFPTPYVFPLTRKLVAFGKLAFSEAGAGDLTGPRQEFEVGSVALTNL
jgi:hypothetical protein